MKGKELKALVNQIEDEDDVIFDLGECGVVNNIDYSDASVDDEPAIVFFFSELEK